MVSMMVCQCGAVAESDITSDNSIASCSSCTRSFLLVDVPVLQVHIKSFCSGFCSWRSFTAAVNLKMFNIQQIAAIGMQVPLVASDVCITISSNTVFIFLKIS